MNVENRGEVGQRLRGGAAADGAGHLQVRLRLDLLHCEGLVGPVQARAQVSGGAGKDEVDVQAVRGRRLLLGEILVHHGGALPPVLLVGAVSREAEERTAHPGEVFVQVQLNLKRSKDAQSIAIARKLPHKKTKTASVAMPTCSTEFCIPVKRHSFA